MELHREGSAMNGATLSSFRSDKELCIKKTRHERNTNNSVPFLTVDLFTEWLLKNRILYVLTYLSMTVVLFMCIIIEPGCDYIYSDVSEPE